MPRRTLRAAVVAAAFLPLASASLAKSRPVSPACVVGSYAAHGLGVGADTAAAVRILLADGKISLRELCPTPVAVRLKAGRRFTAVAATWPSCPGNAGKVVLRARMATGCATLSGTLTSRKTKPKRRRFTAAQLAPQAVALDDLANADLAMRMERESLPSTIRAGAEALNPEIAALIATGPAAVDGILDVFRGDTGLADDLRLSLLAYVLERIGDARAVPVLADWLDHHLFASGLWADDLVTHALKVLAGQTDLNTQTYIYTIDAKLDAIAQARAGIPSTIAAPQRFHARAAGPSEEDRNRCQQSVVVTGINAAGQQESVTIPYKTVFLDIQEQIDTATPAKRPGLERQLAGFREADERAYGGSEYHVIAGSDVSVRSNCGGSVTERLLNAVAERNGFDVRLGDGNTGAADIRNLARKFGSEVGVTEIDPFTVIAHEGDGGDPAHVEIPMSVNGGSAVVFSKDNQGAPRLHTVSTATALNPFGFVERLFNFRPFSRDGITTRFYRLDPTRIVSVTVDSSACPCEFAAGGSLPVAITDPVDADTSERVVTVAGTVGSPEATSGTLRVNGSLQGLTLGAGGFSSQVVLHSGANQVRVSVDGPYGRRGCAERTITSNTPRTTLSATLTWNLADADLDLYVIQPDGETAWYGGTSTGIGGRLDVDNRRGFGPENYFLASDESNRLSGGYAIRVHYFSDHQRTDQQPTRVVAWHVVVIVNEGTPDERRGFLSGTLAADNPTNDLPGASGPDWATAATPTL